MGCRLHPDFDTDLLLHEYWHLFVKESPPGPILDLASGTCRNGLFLARKGLEVVCCDISAEALERAKRIADEQNLKIAARQIDLEREGINPLPQEHFAGILVFSYLHRPLIPCIKKAMQAGGILIYETYTIGQRRFGKPHNPDYLLKDGELLSWFADWQVIHHFEGIREEPRRAVAQLVCRKPV